MESLLNFNRETHKVHHKKISEQLDGIAKWIQSVGGSNEEETLDFIQKYFCHLNDNTKKSMFEHILDLTNTRLQDVNKQNDLIKLIEELCKLKHQVRFI